MGVLGGAHIQGIPSCLTYVVIDLDLVKVGIPRVPVPGPSCCQAKRQSQPAKQWALFQSFPPQGEGIYLKKLSADL